MSIIHTVGFTLAQLERFISAVSPVEFLDNLAYDLLMPIIGLGAECDLYTENEYQASFTVSEFAVLDVGRRVVLHQERGFTVANSVGDPWLHLSVESLERDVRTTVLPDDDEHPWGWLSDLLRAHGVETSQEELKGLPYKVIFSERLLARLAPTGDRGP